WIVTSKPEPQAKKVVRLLNLDSLVDGVIGASLAETDTKTDLVKRALAAAKAASSAVVMVGDRHYDETGAIENNVLPIGALWGFGSRNELQQAGAVTLRNRATTFVPGLSRQVRALRNRVAPVARPQQRELPGFADRPRWLIAP